MSSHNILFVTSEVYPLIKTGGLADVAGSLPAALKGQSQDVRVIMPAYREAMRKAEKLGFASFRMEGVPETVRLLEGRLPGTTVRLYLVDSPPHFDRPGGPYVDPDGHDWADNAERFALFARAVTAVALNKAELDWQPDIVHCNDWQSGLVPALLAPYPKRPASVFTVHNLAYHGFFEATKFHSLKLPSHLWGVDGLEFHGGLSFIKGGLVFADMISTVSPTYAEEIRTPHFGHGLDGLLNHRAERLMGILNGVDYKQWDPAKDPHVKYSYDAHHMVGKARNKQQLQAQFGLPQRTSPPLLGLVGRLAEQKGIDLVLSIIPELVKHDVQLAILGSGDKHIQTELQQAAKLYPEHIAVHIGFSEPLAHQIEAGADMFLMPSRFEPCGLNQIYSLRYGTVPIVRRTGGLADTVVDASDENIARKAATGFVFTHATHDGLWGAAQRAIAVFRGQPQVWQQLIANGMRQDFSWKQSAKHYLELYQLALEKRQS
ncbi:glycogen synthase [Candidatus Tenderia electrophaga]|jgi:starch synthase|uniref:Glycogen synthase n=1 Tax=Candidatus Tenderia electrophaga TaxID=1748243 RepID=A0A0S2TBC8_9GAMM|nr:glycogen synthase [Candidatus Tenderia electrophaga]